MAGAAVGLGALFLGYSVAYYGVTQIQGGNWGFFDLTLPSRWPGKKNVPRDTPQKPDKTYAQTHNVHTGDLSVGNPGG